MPVGPGDPGAGGPLLTPPTPVREEALTVESSSVLEDPDPAFPARSLKVTDRGQYVQYTLIGVRVSPAEDGEHTPTR